MKLLNFITNPVQKQKNGKKRHYNKPPPVHPKESRREAKIKLQPAALLLIIH